VFGVVFAGAGVAGFPVEELWPAGSTPLDLDPAGHGAMFWPTARVAETRNDHNHIMFVFNFIKPPKHIFVSHLGAKEQDLRGKRQKIGKRFLRPHNTLCAATDAVKFVPKPT
jgi:hypothetical protein